MELVDPRLVSDFNKEEVIRVIKIALLCTNPSPALRPIMSKVVSMLEGQAAVEEVMTDPSVHGDELRFKVMRNQFEQLSRSNASESQPLVQSTSDTIWDGSSATSAHDLYPYVSE